MFSRIVSALLGAAALAACTTPEEPAEPIRTMPGEDSPCVADDAQSFVGQKATQSVGEQIMIATRAEIFQWVPPDTAVTMDYRLNRVRVSYDRDQIITLVRCG